MLFLTNTAVQVKTSIEVNNNYALHNPNQTYYIAYI